MNRETAERQKIEGERGEIEAINIISNATQTDQLGAFGFKFNTENINYHEGKARK